MRLVRRKLISSCSIRRMSWERTVTELSTPARKPRFDDNDHNDSGHDGVGNDGLGGYDTDVLRGWRRGAGDHVGEAAAAFRAVARQTSIARRSFSNGAAPCSPRAVLRVRRGAVLLLRRRTCGHR